MLFLIVSIFAFAGEPDNFSGRNTPPQNEIVNQYVQARLVSIADTHNKSNKDKTKCDNEEIEKHLEDTFDRNWPDVYGLKWEAKTDGPENFDNSILKGTMRSQFMVPSITLRLNGKNYSVGLDKLDHLFSHGYLYWKIIGKDPKMPKEKILQALQFGTAQEEGPWGLKAAGQKSYGDMAANYLGLAFWKDLWDGSPPFFACVEGQLIIKKQFKIEDYFNASVDEAINCNSYASQEMASTIIQRTEVLNRKCPIDPGVCKDLNKTISENYQSYILHPLCRGITSNQVEKPSDLTVKDILDGGSALVSGGGNFLKLIFPPAKMKVIEKGPPPATGVR